MMSLRLLAALLVCHTLLLAVTAWAPASLQQGASSLTPLLSQVRVCQNKDCCQRFSGVAAHLPETLQDLGVSPSGLKTTGCLSQCGRGPNVEVQSKQSEPAQLLTGLDSAAAVAVALEDLGMPIRSQLLAAVNVMERADKASSLEEKDFMLSSVIRVLQTEPDLAQSSALSRAYATRAACRLDAQTYPSAMLDAQQAVALLATERSLARAYRVWSDACRAMGQPEEAQAVLKQWAQQCPSYRSKVAKELESLLHESSGL